MLNLPDSSHFLHKERLVQGQKPGYLGILVNKLMHWLDNSWNMVNAKYKKIQLIIYMHFPAFTKFTHILQILFGFYCINQLIWRKWIYIYIFTSDQQKNRCSNQNTFLQWNGKNQLNFKWQICIIYHLIIGLTKTFLCPILMQFKSSCKTYLVIPSPVCLSLSSFSIIFVSRLVSAMGSCHWYWI